MKETIKNVLKWADEKGILKNGTPLAQHTKTEEEVKELHEALFAKRNGEIDFFDSKGNFLDTNLAIEDAIGDIMVTLIIQAELNSLSIEDCLEYAYNEIKDRKGKMIDGVFEKEN